MRSPHDDARQAGRIRLADDQVADARLVGPPLVVDDDDPAGPRRGIDRLEEHVDASAVRGGQRRPGERLPRCEPSDAERRVANRDRAPDERVAHGRRGRVSSATNVPSGTRTGRVTRSTDAGSMGP